MRPDLEGAAAEALQRLQAGLPPHLTYHRVEHTSDDVVPAARRLAELEGVTGHDLTLLIAAAWYHDLGYIERSAGHEAVSIAVAREVLPSYGFSAADLDAIEVLIDATRIPQTPANDLAGLLADADLDVLGRPDAWEKNAALRSEMAANGSVHDDLAWFDNQIAFLRRHRYFSASAQQLRNEGKVRFLEEMIQARAAL